MRCVLFITNGKTGNRSGMFFGMVPVRRAEPGMQSTRRNPKVAFPYYYHHPRGFPGEIIEPKGHTLQRGKEARAREHSVPRRAGKDRRDRGG